MTSVCDPDQTDNTQFNSTWVTDCLDDLEMMHYITIQSSMSLTDMRLTEYMVLTEKSATTKLFI